MNKPKQTWFITGAGRGLGVELAKAALAAGHNVVAAGRNTETVAEAIGEHDDLLVVRLDVTNAEQTDAAIAAAVERFSRVDVLVNNAGNFIAGFFEEISPAQVRAQVGTLLFGTMAVTRAVLPTMRAQRAGKIVSISSTAGIVGQQFCSAYAAAKFGVEGWMESLATEVEQFGISTTIVEPGFFRTGGWQAPTPCRPLRTRQRRSWSKSMPTANSPAPSPTTTRDSRREAPSLATASAGSGHHRRLTARRFRRAISRSSRSARRRTTRQPAPSATIPSPRSYHPLNRPVHRSSSKAVAAPA